MTGYANFNYDKFEAITRYLYNSGYNVTSPHEVGQNEGWEYHHYIEECIARMVTEGCNVWAGMKGWTKSRGARIEFGIAMEMGLRAAFITETNRGPGAVDYSIDWQ